MEEIQLIGIQVRKRWGRLYIPTLLSLPSAACLIRVFDNEE